jgi:hypothetical protein
MEATNMDRYEAQITLRNAVHYLESQRYDTPITSISLDDLSDAIDILYKAMEVA